MRERGGIGFERTQGVLREKRGGGFGRTGVLERKGWGRV
jgi:hypothetical protein